MIDLPATPYAVEMTPSLVSFGGTLTPALGGPSQRINRLGDRFRVEATLPPMPYDVGRVWVSRLNRAQSDEVRWGFYQPGIAGGGQFGAPQAGTGGKRVVFRDDSGYTFQEGRFLNVEGADGRSALHQIDATVTGTGAGGQTYDAMVTPPLRWPITNVRQFADEIRIVGLLQGDERRWTVDVAMNVGLSFAIMERR